MMKMTMKMSLMMMILMMMMMMMMTSEYFLKMTLLKRIRDICTIIMMKSILVMVQ